MTERGLRRYDPGTLHSISRLQNQHASIIPRISIPGDHYLHDLSSFNQGGTANTGIDTIGRQTGQIHRGLLANPEPAEDWELNLFNIQEVGTARFLHLLKKYPSIVILLFGLFVLWGRGFHVQNLTQEEKNMAISAIVAGATAIAGICVTSQHHSNDKDNAKKQLAGRITVGIINAVVSIVVIVFSTISLTKIHDKIEDDVAAAINALNFDDRTAYAGILIGVSLLLGSFSLLSIIFGSQALRKIHKEEKVIKHERIRRQTAAYATPTFGGIGPY
uniref:MgtE domain-containing protein n=1 Tax=Panagrellus redivivus TaxID=6233 RepID=A0A7E4UL53_PANRE